MILLCIVRVAVKNDRVVKTVRAKAKTLGQQFKQQVKELPPREIPPSDEEERARIAQAKAEKYEADMDRRDARAAEEANLSDAAKRRLQKQRQRDAAIKARQKAKRKNKNLAAARYDTQRTVQAGSLEPGTRIAFDPSHKGVDSLDVNKQQDLLKRTNFGTLRAQAAEAGHSVPASSGGLTPRAAWQDENPLPHGDNWTQDELTQVQEMYPAASASGYNAEPPSESGR